jgi:hypothetical protein
MDDIRTGNNDQLLPRTLDFISQDYNWVEIYGSLCSSTRSRWRSILIDIYILSPWLILLSFHSIFLHDQITTTQQ